MVSLYLDCSQELVFGILDDSLSWIDYCRTGKQKSSNIVHSLIYSMLDKHSLNFAMVKRFFYAAGPGSYTGVRVVEGIAQILAWENLEVFSFYHFEVPKLLNVQQGLWISNAFKNELFLYHWDQQKTNIELIDKKQFLANSQTNFSAYTLDKMEHIESVNCTIEMVNQRSRELFSKVYDMKMRRESFYYRSIEQEFKMPDQKS